MKASMASEGFIEGFNEGFTGEGFIEGFTGHRRFQ